MIFVEFEFAPGQPSRLRLEGLETTGPARSRLTTMAQDGYGLTVVFIGRLHYHADLKRRFGLSLDPDTAVAAEWVLAAFRARGAAALDDLEGEFGFFLFDSRTGQLRLQRSPVGDVPLFYARKPGGAGYVAATDLQAVAAKVGPVRVREEHLARFLIDPVLGEKMGDDEAVFDPIRNLVPGSRVALSAASSQVEWTWDWANLMTGTNRLGREEAARQFLNLLDEAIYERANGDRTAAHHSGGFDSSTIVCRARDQVAAGRSVGPLATISLDYPFVEMSGEGAYMRLITDQGGPIDPVFLRENAALDFEGFPDAVPHHDEPNGYLFRAGIDRQLLDVAAEKGARTVLTGGGAEVLTEPSLDYLTDLSRAGDWGSVSREAKSWALDRRTHLGAIAWQYAIQPRLPACLRSGLGVWWRNGLARWPHLDSNTLAPWMRPEFARRTGAFANACAFRGRLERKDVERSKKAAEIRSGVTSWAGWHLAMKQKGIVVSHPFLDPRLLAFGLSLPREVRQEPGQTKPLLAEATRGVLPEPIRTRRYKCGFDRVNLEGFRRALPRLRQLVLSAPDNGIFVREKLLQTVEEYGQGRGNALVGTHVTASLALIVWQQQIAAQPRPTMTGSLIDLGGQGARLGVSS